MKKSLFIFILILGVHQLRAQNVDSLKYKYTNQTIYRYGNAMMRGTEKLGFSELQHEFFMSETGMDAYLKAKKLRNTGKIFRFITMGFAISVFGVIANHPAFSQRSLIYGLFAGELAAGMVSGRYISLSNQTLDKAIWQRNKDLLFPTL